MNSYCRSAIAALWVCGLPALASTIVYTSVARFVSATGPNTVANFNDVPPDTNAPFTSDGVGFANAQVLNNAAGLPESFWFCTQGSGSSWALTNTYYDPLTITFAPGADTFGFLFTCFACDVTPHNAGPQWSLPSASGAVVGSGTTAYNLYSGSYPAPNFLGVTSDVSFESVTVTRGGRSARL